MEMSGEGLLKQKELYGKQSVNKKGSRTLEGSRGK